MVQVFSMTRILTIFTLLFATPAWARYYGESNLGRESGNASGEVDWLLVLLIIGVAIAIYLEREK